ncbi:MAG: hypothetical protein HC845_09660 [Akkermansiaceae bacterium]|nr:hypothetical protein [Akkermansiaceae bacterium]NJR42044.1 hypothetical protein [Akkermansiaceae bacterium]
MKIKLMGFSFLAAWHFVIGASAQDTPPPLAPLPKISAEMNAPAAAAPADVIASATKAVEELGNEVVLGHYQVAVEK